MQDATGRVHTALVLGATSEITQATVRRLVAAGTRELILGARDPADLAAFAAELEAAGAHARTVAFDATAYDTHAPLVQEAFGDRDVDLVVLGWGAFGHLEQALDEPDTAVEMLQVNLTGAASVLLYASNRLREQGHGTVVVFSSIAAARVRRTIAVYGASKAGLDGLALALGDHLHGSGVRIVVVRPGFVRTKMTAGRRVPPGAIEADEVAAAVVDAVASGRDVVWVPRRTALIGFVLRLLPRPLFRRVPF